MRSTWRWVVSSGLAGLVVTTAILAARGHRGDRPAAVDPEGGSVPGASLPGAHP